MIRTIGLLLLPLAAACASATRLYDGEARAPEEVALVRVAYERGGLGGLLLQDDLGGRLLAVDGVDLDAEDVKIAELLPGPHVLVARCWTEDGRVDVAGELELDGRAGAEYSIALATQDGVRWYLVLHDDDGEFLDHSLVAPEEANPLQLELDDREWLVADTSKVGPMRSITWVPRGEKPGEWSRVVEVFEFGYPGGAPPTIDVALEHRRGSFENAAAKTSWTVLERSETSASYAYEGDVKRGAFATWPRRRGAGFLRREKDRLILAIYEVNEAPLDDAERDAWHARFASAPLR